jgi:hypothetical protein
MPTFGWLPTGPPGAGNAAYVRVIIEPIARAACRTTQVDIITLTRRRSAFCQRYQQLGACRTSSLSVPIRQGLLVKTVEASDGLITLLLVRGKYLARHLELAQYITDIDAHGVNVADDR